MKKLIGIIAAIVIASTTPVLARGGGGHGGGYHGGGGHGGYHGGSHGGYHGGHGGYRGGYAYRGYGYRGGYHGGYGYGALPWIGLGVGAAIVGGAIVNSCWQYVQWPDGTVRNTWVCQ